MSQVDFSDVQGLAAFGYGKLAKALYLLLRIRDAGAARRWISAAPVSSAEYRDPPPSTAMQIAFTPSGLAALGVPQSIAAGFSPEFLSGLSTDASRSRRLGDVGPSDPANWTWGRPDRPADLLVMLFAGENLAEWQQAIQAAPWDEAFEAVATLTTSDMGGKEPFGFADGISQPEFDWKRERAAVENTIAYENRVALGELLLGYPNEYGKYTDRPLVDPESAGAAELLPAEDAPGRRDLGRNGTYLVLRQLEQDVRGFWQYIDGAAAGDPRERYRLGACMVGRTVDGEPLIPKSGERIPGVFEKPGSPRNAFRYDDDPSGTACPLGAHVRRANPRNADLFGRPADPIAKIGSQLGIPRPRLRDDLKASTRFHRILRRGREYGTPLAPEDALRPPPPDESPRGLHFVCLGANIARQFEFVQNAWLMSTKFDGMSGESDPLLGNRHASGESAVTGYFSIPREGKVARRLTRIPQFITVRGGAYFFLPGLRALRYIVRAGENPAR